MENAQRALSAVPGVRGAEVRLEGGSARVEVGAEFLDTQLLAEAIRQAGYSTDLNGAAVAAPAEPAPAAFEIVSMPEAVPATPRPEPPFEAPAALRPDRGSERHPGADLREGVPGVGPVRGQMELRIEGMTCASCVAKVRGALMEVPGVSEARVNFATHRAQVEADRSVSSGRLVQAVRSAGYGAEVLAGDEDLASVFTAERRRQETEIQGWRNQALFAGGVSAALMLLPFHALAGVHAVLATAVQMIAGWRFYRGAWRGILARSANMDSLIALSTTVAWAYGIYLLRADQHAHHEFMTATMLLAFISLGKYLEGRGRLRAGQALRALLELAPATAHRIEGESTIDVPARELRPGDRCRVLQGERLPADGSLLASKATGSSGVRADAIAGAEAEIDESMLTGESVPVVKKGGEPLYGGTINLGGPLTLVVERIGAKTTLSQIARRVDEAQNTRPRIQALADRVAAIFVPAVIAVAVLTFLSGLAFGTGFQPALMRAVAVLIVACPCALGLATPLAVMAGVGVAARRGIIVRSAESLEASRDLDLIVFDKTGTLTEGAPEVTAWVPSREYDQHALMDAAASLESESPHPLARAIRASARAHGISPRRFSGVDSVAGGGVRCAHPPLVLGSAEFLKSEGVRFEGFGAEFSRRERRGETLVGVGVPGGDLIGAIALTDQIKPGAARGIQQLRAMGLKTTMLSGDSETATRAVADLLGLDDFRARVSPERKADTIAALQRLGQRVAMVGDGINDAPALAQADLGIAMASGSDIAQEAAGLVTLSGDPRQVAASIQLARRIRGKMIQNLGWAFAYNLVLIPLAALGYLQPIFASAAMAASSVSVVANALMLYRARE